MGSRSRPIGIFDSGVGGLSVLRAIRELLPEEDLIFFADQSHAPYGPRPHEEIRAFSEAITRFLLAHDAKAIVVACNSASAAALKHLREIHQHPAVPVVGMEPAVKPATERSRSHVIGVLATSATFQGNLYRKLLEKYATGTRVLESPCPGLVQAIERAHFDHPETRRILQEAIDPMLQAGADTLVLGCTHYPFVKPLIREICGEGIEIIDPAPAVARYVKKLLGEAGKLRDSSILHASGPHALGQLICYTTGSVSNFNHLLPRLIGTPAEVRPATWTPELELASEEAQPSPAL